jgi:hypothetical protein
VVKFASPTDVCFWMNGESFHDLHVANAFFSFHSGLFFFIFRVLCEFREIYADKVPSANPSLNKQIAVEFLIIYEKLAQYCDQFRHPMTSLVDFHAPMLIRHSVAPLMDPNSPQPFAHLSIVQCATPILIARLHPHVYLDQIRDYQLQFSPTLDKRHHQIIFHLFHVPTAERDQKLVFGDAQGDICIQ